MVKFVKANGFHPTSFLLQHSGAVDHVCHTVELEIIFLILTVIC